MKKKNKKYQPIYGEGAARNNINKQVALKETTVLVSIATRSDTHLSSVGEGLKLSAVIAISLGIKQSFVRTKLRSRM